MIHAGISGTAAKISHTRCLRIEDRYCSFPASGSGAAALSIFRPISGTSFAPLYTEHGS